MAYAAGIDAAGGLACAQQRQPQRVFVASGGLHDDVGTGRQCGNEFDVACGGIGQAFDLFPGCKAVDVEPFGADVDSDMDNLCWRGNMGVHGWDEFELLDFILVMRAFASDFPGAGSVNCSSSSLSWHVGDCALRRPQRALFRNSLSPMRSGGLAVTNSPEFQAALLSSQPEIRTPSTYKIWRTQRWPTEDAEGTERGEAEMWVEQSRRFAPQSFEKRRDEG